MTDNRLNTPRIATLTLQDLTESCTPQKQRQLLYWFFEAWMHSLEHIKIGAFRP